MENSPQSTYRLTFFFPQQNVQHTNIANVKIIIRKSEIKYWGPPTSISRSRNTLANTLMKTEKTILTCKNENK